MDAIEIRETTEAMMKSLIDVQKTQGEQIGELKDMILGIRETMMNSLRFELHDQMMECIKRGYATEDEYDRITEKMHDYLVNLHGNHGLEDLFEDRFKKLKIQ